MKLQMTSSNRAIVAIVALLVLAFVFWAQLLSPKREEAKELGAKVEQLEASLAQHNAEIAEGEEAKSEFSSEYQRLVVVGKAVPSDDDVASLLVQMNRLADRTGGTLRDIQLSAEGGGEEATPPPAAAAAPASATEVAASLLPLGATIGPAGLAVMPYTATFDGNFVQIADFIKGIDSLVATKNEEVAVDGRLVTVDGFALEADPEVGFPALQASFALTTYLTPPGEAGGVTPGGTEAAPVATTTGALP
jgi:Tfp pilus assembly protein PilO